MPLAWVVQGCAPPAPLCQPFGATPALVLTFDDGPLPADRPEDATEIDELLAPLRAILDALADARARGVFFVSAGGIDAGDHDLLNAFGRGLVEIHAAGHVLGYHASRHEPSVWMPVGTPPQIALAGMSRDLDELQSIIDDALGLYALPQAMLFAPVFRQPYGGGVLFQGPGRTAARRRGWVYRGYAIDSGDWTGHADAPPAVVARLPVFDDVAHERFTRERLRSGVASTADRAVVDVLFHVNRFTARRLPDWLDELSAAASEFRGEAVEFAVPACYLAESDARVDPGVLAWAAGLR
jgi:peptidoglycan/xylan/chitin deacetylase (PgdA/CDA1 family)